MVPFRLTICGIDEIAGHSGAGITDVLSILDPDWPVPDGFAAYGAHRRLLLRFHDVIEKLPDRLPPHPDDVARLLAFGRELADRPDAHLLIHCHAGVSRSTAAASLILTQARPDRPAEEALAAVVALRPRAWPNLRIIEIGDALLGRDGTLVAAARAHYRHFLDREPWMAETMIDAGRGREVAVE
jgi:predicted protein tyrosine phosphatase